MCKQHGVELFCSVLKETFECCILTKRDHCADDDAEKHGDSSALDTSNDSEEGDKEDEGKRGLFKLDRNRAGEHSDDGADN